MDILISYYPILHLPSIRPNSLALLKKSGSKTQKWGIVGADGQLKVFQFKSKSLKNRFNYTSPSASSESLIPNGDSFLMSVNREIYQINRKGAASKFKNTPFENSISCLAMNSTLVAASCGLISSLQSDHNQAIPLPAQAVSVVYRENICYVGCNDGTVSTFIGGGTQQIARLPSAITCMAPIQRKHGQSILVVGCADSTIRFYNDKDKLISSMALSSSATAIGSYDFDKDGFAEIVVGLEDSTINLISIALIDTPKVVSSMQLGFNVSNIGIGTIYSSDMISILVTSQTGQVGIVFIEPRSDRSLLTSKAPKVTEKEIEDLKKRVNDLENKAKSANVKPTSVPAQTSVEIRGDPVTQKFIFLVESERPISRIALSSTVQLKFYPRTDCQTVISPCPPHKDHCSCIVRPLDQTATRVAFDFSYEIGKGGELISYISFVKNQAVLNKNFTLKPFGLLKRVTDDSLLKIHEDSLGIIEVTGSSTSTFRGMLDNCLPTMLEDDEPQTFSSGPIGSLVTVIVRGDKFVAKSIFFPIVVQLRTFILESMNKAKQRVTFETKLGENCIFTFFKKIKDRLLEVMIAGSLYYKLKALQEVKNSSPTANFGDEETARVLQDAASIEKKFAECKDEYDAFINEIQIFYTEMWKKNNIDASSRVPDLLTALKEVKDEDTLNVLIEFMRSQPK
ncbi:hypothetical protein TRFO_21698 [Tritrichomonas foetus]|uniref:Uncharacterized protein n=1 Tax=Tritrichomonas foetus TaxID=1144522 RepID=A0A1J4KJ71_9EUKA|nr:hypothetical protein TRFO_21698 [Tritrichomonas foetus]|eukprot:OHT09381.1 hypothetical protein TRFO_21698 [Tritrichomonas foetus]